MSIVSPEIETETFPTTSDEAKRFQTGLGDHPLWQEFLDILKANREADIAEANRIADLELADRAQLKLFVW